MRLERTGDAMMHVVLRRQVAGRETASGQPFTARGFML
jgi:hypothetical protein